MARKIIDIYIDKNAKMKITTTGFSGPECTERTKFLELLGTIEKEEKTPEYYETREYDVVQTIKG